MTEKNYATRLINEYGEKKQTKLDELKALDKKVKRPVRVFAYVFGTIASLILGTGMCFAMQVLNYGEVMQYVGVGIGVIGLGRARCTACGEVAVAVNIDFLLGCELTVGAAGNAGPVCRRKSGYSKEGCEGHENKQHSHCSGCKGSYCSFLFHFNFSFNFSFCFFIFLMIVGGFRVLSKSASLIPRKFCDSYYHYRYFLSLY